MGQEGQAVKQKKIAPLDRSDFLWPRKHRSGQRPRRFATLDLESKRGETEEAGFERVFLCGTFDGRRVRQWRNEGESCNAPWSERAVAPGGCIDRMMILVSRKAAARVALLRAQRRGLRLRPRRLVAREARRSIQLRGHDAG